MGRMLLVRSLQIGRSFSARAPPRALHSTIQRDAFRLIPGTAAGEPIMSLASLAFAPALLSLLGTAAVASPVTYEDIAQTIKDHRIATMPEAIASLPAEMRSNYTLMGTSRSAQNASPLFPRAILFESDSAALVATFNGHSDQANYNRLEFMQYREQTKEFELRFISFGSSVKFSEKNPAECLHCHGQSPRPIWGTYERWTGSYGDVFDNSRPSLSYKDFLGFLGAKNQHDRYRSLLSDSKHPLFPYADNGADSDDAESHSLRPNDRLGNFLGRMFAAKVANAVKQNPYFQTHRATALLGLLHESEFYISDDPTLACEGLQPEDLVAYDQQILKDLHGAYPENQYPELYKDLAVQGYWTRSFILEKLLSGLSTYNWSIEFPGKRLVEQPLYSVGTVTTEDLVAAELFEDSLFSLPELKSHFQWKGSSYLYSPSYEQRAVAPYGQWYDRAGLAYNIGSMRKVCGLLFSLAKKEW